MIRLHSIAGSRSFRVLWLLHELGEDPEVIRYGIINGSLHTEEFRAISPARRAPALEIDGRVLFESGAIVQYLCETRDGHGLMPALGDPERADWLMWLHYSETLACHIQNLNMQHLFLPDPSSRSVTVMGLETKRLAITLQGVEQALQGHDYLLPSGFSAVDIMMGFTLESASHYVRFDRFPKLSAYRDRIAARPAYRSAQDAEGPQEFYDRDFYEMPGE
ncbi:glutathione S-transferase family protein [Thalassovita sp.]|uniref:glutathione S-transferase family protein n=1 Tax=Thalassovita sp. TaxID=1979401 RepID=UPI002B2742E6|nr:glutathione S-transferase family protein [Thalassovita sp.]